MTRLSINEMTTYRWSFDEDLAQYRRLGVPAVGVWRQKLADFGEERGIDLLRETGLTVSNLLWAGGFTGSDVRSFRESIDDALDAIHLAAEMQAECLVVYTGSRAGHTQNHARRLLTDALAELMPAARSYEVSLALEPMHPGCAGEWTFLTTLEETLAITDAQGDGSLKLALDTYHFGADPFALELASRRAERIAVVHLADRKETPGREQNRCRLGEGTIPLSEIVAALESGGYEGYYDLELLGEEIEEADYDELIDHSQRALAQLLVAATAEAIPRSTG